MGQVRVSLLFTIGTGFFWWTGGAGAGAISGKLYEIGLDDKFMKELGETITSGSSALFVLVRRATPDKVLEELKHFKGKVLKTSLTEDKEEKLREVLSEM